MKRLQSQLGGFQAAILAPVGGAPLTSAVATEVSAFVCGIERKIRFVELHLAVLSGIHWGLVERIGRRLAGAAHPTHLTIPLAEVSLTIEHADAVIDHVYAMGSRRPSSTLRTRWGD